MANGRRPGPECRYLTPVQVEDGTMCRQSSSAPGPICFSTIGAAGHFFAISEVVDLALLGVGLVALGSEALTAGKELSAFASVALQATSEAELDDAGKHLARFVAIVGVDTAIAVLLHKAAGKANRAGKSGAPVVQGEVV